MRLKKLMEKIQDQLNEFYQWLQNHGYIPEDDNEEPSVTGYREIDGSNNNPYYDGGHETFIRMAPSDYGPDGAPSGADRPSAREVSNVIFSQTESVPDSGGASDMFWLWGQFIDHDIDLTAGGGDLFSIDVPMGDIHFDPFYTGTQQIMMSRSGSEDVDGTPEQINEITPFIDASMVYGSDAARNEFIRGEGGKLVLDADGLLPYNTGGFENAAQPFQSPEEMYLAGDVRANENAALTSMHTLFAREHNRLVDELQQQHPEYDAETLYQEAKMLVEAKIQAITYNDFLPILIGEDTLGSYDGYNEDIDPQIANIFATAAYRLGHTMLSTHIERINEDGSTIAEGHLALQHAFFNPTILSDNPDMMDAIMRGMSYGHAETVDTLIIDDVRNFLFGPPGAGGFDLASLNIQRGRDHALSDYNSAREAYNLARVEEFSDITTNTELAAKLEMLYGTVDNIDVFVGGLAEDTVEGAMVGELFQTILADQFARLRDGDAYWYENRFTEDELDMIYNTHLSDIIKDNTDIEYLQENVFIAYNRMGGDNGRDKLNGTSDNDLMIGFKGKDILKGKAGDDELYGGKHNDKLYGNKGDDKLFGEEGHDKLFGGKGDDMLEGGKGNDLLVGGPGLDTFVFTEHSGDDTIRDFQPGDLIDLSGYTGMTFDELDIFKHKGDTIIKLDFGDSITLDGVKPFQISEDDFIF